MLILLRHIYFFQFSVDVIAEIAAHCPSLNTLRLAGMKEVDDQLLTAVAENCCQLSCVSIKGCGLVNIIILVQNIPLNFFYHVKCPPHRLYK